jgi:hypothetical protein
MWSTGYENGCRYWIKHYEEGSMFGINNGRISKLYVTLGGRVIMNYSRGWDVKPGNAGAKALLRKLLEVYN